MRANGSPRRAWPAYDALLVLLLTLVAAVRLYKLGAWSFWVDEMFTLHDSLDKSSLFHNLTYPLSYILIGAAMKSGGVSEWTARIIPCVVGIITPAAIYLLARREFGRGPALGAAVLLAVSPWHLYWSQMARFYTMTMLFSAAAALLFFSGYERKSPWRMGAAAVLMALAGLSHYSAFLIMGALVVYTIANHFLKWPEPAPADDLPRSRKKALFSFYLPFGLAGIAIAPKALFILQCYSKPNATTGTSFDNPLKGAIYVLFSTFYRVEFAVAVAAVLSAFFLLRRRDRRGLFLTALIVVPLAALMVAGWFSRGENRYALVTLPAFTLLAGFGMTMVYDALRPRSRALAVLAPIALLIPLVQHSATYFSSLSGGERWNYRAAAELIRRSDLPGDLVLTPMSLPMGYYLKDSGLMVRTLEPKKLDAYVKRYKRIWFVVEDSTRGRSASLRSKDWLRERCDLVGHFPASSPMADYSVSVYFLGPTSYARKGP